MAVRGARNIDISLNFISTLIAQGEKTGCKPRVSATDVSPQVVASSGLLVCYNSLFIACHPSIIGIFDVAVS